MEPLGLRAWLFDLDGVLTDTARLHVEAWKATFDELLERHGQAPFDPVVDYERYVDGKPRAAGVRDFLAARGIVLPEDGPGDADHPTVVIVGDAKNRRFLELLDSEGVEPYPSSVAFVTALRDAGRLTAVVSASENCWPVLRAARLHGHFYAVVDGTVAKAEHLAGKPQPDTYCYGAALIGVTPAEAAVVEDAPAGVAAARSGGFGYVVGIARRASSEELLRAGADVVVRDLEEFPEFVSLLTRWAAQAGRPRGQSTTHEMKVTA